MLDYATIVTYVAPCWPLEAHRQSHKYVGSVDKDTKVGSVDKGF